MTTKQKIDILACVFKAAKEAAIAADPGEGMKNDGGTCNLDTPAFKIKGMRRQTIEKAARKAGVGVTQFHWFGGRIWYWLDVPRRGQANRRSTMSSAASKVLSEFQESGIIPGFRACQYCQMD